MSVNYSVDDDERVSGNIQLEDVLEEIDAYLDFETGISKLGDGDDDWYHLDYSGKSHVFENGNFGKLRLFWIEPETAADGSIVLSIALDSSASYTVTIVYDKSKDILMLDLLYFGNEDVPPYDEDDFAVEDVRLAEFIMDMIKIVNPHTGKTIDDLMGYDAFEDRRFI